MANKYLIGSLILVILTASIYIMLPNNVRIDIQETKSTFKVWENNSWILAGTEYTKIYDGSSLMKANKRVVNFTIEGNHTTIYRYAYFKENIVAIDIYNFDGNTKDIELIPINHEIKILNGQGKILNYEVNDLSYKGITKTNLFSPQSFGHNMKVEWEDGNYYSRIFKYTNKEIGKLEVKYKINSSDYSKEVRLFDPTDIVLSGTDIVADVYGLNTSTFRQMFLLKYNISKVPAGLSISSVNFCSEAIDYGTSDTDLNVTRFNNQTWTETINAAGVNAGPYTNPQAKAFNSTTDGAVTCFDITEAFNLDYETYNYTSIRVEDPDRVVPIVGVVYDNSHLFVGVTGAVTQLCDSEGTSACSPTPFITVSYIEPDSQNPTANITYPQNVTYTLPVTQLNFTTTDNVALSKCWYSTNGGVTNSSTNDCSTNFTGLTSIEGLNNWTFYVNDTSSNQNSSKIFFTYTPQFILNITNPTTENKANVTIGQKIQIYFNFTKANVIINQSVNVTNVTIGGTKAEVSLQFLNSTQGLLTSAIFEQDNISIYYPIDSSYNFGTNQTVGQFGDDLNTMRGWADLKSSPFTNVSQALLAWTKKDKSSYVTSWNGDSWGSVLTLCSSCAYSEYNPNAIVEYEHSSGQGLVVYISETNSSNLVYRTWTGTWSNEGSLPYLSGTEIGNLFLIPDKNSDKIMLLAKGTNKNLWGSVWTGSSWTSTQELSNFSGGAAYENTPYFEWESLSGDGVLLYDNSQITSECLYRNFTTSSNTWSSAGSFTCKGTSTSVTAEDLSSDPNSDMIYGWIYGFGLSGDFRMVRWNGNSWDNIQTINTNFGLDGKLWLDVIADRQGNAYYIYTTNDTGGSIVSKKWNGTGLESAVTIYDIIDGVATHPVARLHPTTSDFGLTFSADGYYRFVYNNGSYSTQLQLADDFDSSDKDFAFDYYTELAASDQQLEFNSTAGWWVVNITIPTGSGLADLFFEADYLTDNQKASNTETEAINYTITDTCTYSSGNWDINCNDNCSISSNVDLGGNNITIVGAGTFITSANITNFKRLFLQGTDSSNKCTVKCINGGCFR